MTGKIILGTAQFGLDYGINNVTGKLSENDLTLLLNHAYNNGVEFLDTAVLYGDSETRIGDYLKNSQNHFRIVSKTPDCTKDELEFHLKSSLKKLNTKKLYGYLLHSFKTFVKDKTIVSELHRLKEKSLVDKIGFSIYYPDELKILIDEKIPFNILQLPYNLFDRRFESWFEELSEKNVEIHVRSVFLQGLFFIEPEKLTNHFLSVKNKLVELNTIAKELKVDVLTLALCFILNNRFINKVIVGVDNINQLEQLLKSVINNCGSIKNHLNNDFIKLSVDDENIIIPSNWK